MRESGEKRKSGNGGRTFPQSNEKQTERAKLPQFSSRTFSSSSGSSTSGLSSFLYKNWLLICCSWSAFPPAFPLEPLVICSGQSLPLSSPQPPHTRMLCSINETLDSFPQRPVPRFPFRFSLQFSPVSFSFPQFPSVSTSFPLAGHSCRCFVIYNVNFLIFARSGRT